MKIELFLDEGEEYPQLFSVWKVNQETGRADLTTRRNYVDDSEGWDQWRKTDDENIRLKAENSKMRELLLDYDKMLASAADELGYQSRVLRMDSVLNALRIRMSELGIEVEE